MDFNHAQHVAEDAARVAGEQIRRWIGKPAQTSQKSSPHDLVTEVDKACQEAIYEVLQQAYPTSAMLGEESVAPGATAAALAVEQATKELLWVVDPIDGTLNFIRGLPACTVSIGLVVDSIGMVGVIYDPMRDEMFSGIRGQGASCNGRPIQVSKEAELASCILASGFPTGAYRGRNAEQIKRFGYHVRNVRAFGSAALHLAYVAAGRLDGFWENDLNAWDLLAGAVLVEAAGGRVSDVTGSVYSLATRHVAATNGMIHDQLLRDLDLDVPLA
ncbi:MAG: inositol monophosphatase family protein [Acidibacillus sp.]|nr:inositol monophosphatase family protein [Acidibacillus sp.]